MEESLTFHDERGHRISAILSRPAQPTTAICVLCHGFLSGKNSTTNKTLTRLLNEKAIATFRFDFSVRAKATGRRHHAVAGGWTNPCGRHPGPGKGFGNIGLVGSSFGGLVSILTAAQRRDIACLALKCPVVDFAEELRLEFGPDELARWQVTDTIPNLMGGPERIRLKYGLYEDSLQQIAYGPAAQIVAPTLIVQGACDELVPLHQSRRLLDALQGPKRLDLLPQADHQFTRGEDFRTMTTAMTDWLVRYLV